MDWLALLARQGVVWLDQKPPATDDEIAALATFCGRPLPNDYIAFLRQANGGILTYDDYWETHLLSTHDIPEWHRGYRITQETMPGALFFGSDAGTEGLVFDIRAHRPDGDYPIFAVNYITVGWDEVIWVAESFTALLTLQRGILDGQ